MGVPAGMSFQMGFHRVISVVLGVLDKNSLGTTAIKLY